MPRERAILAAYKKTEVLLKSIPQVSDKRENTSTFPPPALLLRALVGTVITSWAKFGGSEQTYVPDDTEIALRVIKEA